MASPKSQDLPTKLQRQGKKVHWGCDLASLFTFSSPLASAKPLLEEDEANIDTKLRLISIKSSHHFLLH